MNESGNLSDDDELDEFEYSQGEEKYAGKNPKNVSTFANKPYDEAYEVSQDLSVAESFDARDKVEIFQAEQLLIANLETEQWPKSGETT